MGVLKGLDFRVWGLGSEYFGVYIGLALFWKTAMYVFEVDVVNSTCHRTLGRYAGHCSVAKLQDVVTCRWC